MSKESIPIANANRVHQGVWKTLLKVENDSIMGHNESHKNRTHRNVIRGSSASKSVHGAPRARYLKQGKKGLLSIARIKHKGSCYQLTRALLYKKQWGNQGSTKAVKRAVQRRSEQTASLDAMDSTAALDGGSGMIGRICGEIMKEIGVCAASFAKHGLRV